LFKRSHRRVANTSCRGWEAVGGRASSVRGKSQHRETTKRLRKELDHWGHPNTSRKRGGKSKPASPHNNLKNLCLKFVRHLKGLAKKGRSKKKKKKKRHLSAALPLRRKSMWSEKEYKPDVKCEDGVGKRLPSEPRAGAKRNFLASPRKISQQPSTSAMCFPEVQ